MQCPRSPGPAFPPISTGVFGYPWPEAGQVSMQALREAVALHEALHVWMVLFSEELLQVLDAELNRQRSL